MSSDTEGSCIPDRLGNVQTCKQECQLINGGQFMKDLILLDLLDLGQP